MENETTSKWYEWDTGQKCPYCGRAIFRRKMKPQYAFMGMCFESDIQCQCITEKQALIKRRNIEKGLNIIRASMIENAGLLKRWQSKTFENFSVHSDQVDIYESCRQFAQNFLVNKHQTGLILCGGIGCGKTHLAAAIAHHVITNTPIDDISAEKAGEQGHYKSTYSPVRFTSTIDLLSNIKSAYNKEGDCESERAIVQKYQCAPLIILDDLGAEKPSEWTQERLFEIIDYRYSEEKPIIITTNRTPAEMKDSMGMRIFDRLKEMSVLISTDAPSQRKEPQNISR